MTIDPIALSKAVVAKAEELRLKRNKSDTEVAMYRMLEAMILANVR